MQQPSLDVLMQRIHSKYELVVAAAKRGRMLTEKEPPQTIEKQPKSVSISLREIADGKLLPDRSHIIAYTRGGK